MKKLILNILSYLVWVLTAAGIPLLLGFARTVHYQRPVSRIEVKPLNKHQADFVRTDDIIREIRNQHVVMSLHSLNLREIERSLSLNPYISRLRVYATLDRELIIRYSERVPFMRVIDITGQWYYLDTSGVIFPDKPDRLFRLLPAIGHIKPPVRLPDQEIALATDSLHNKTYGTILRLGKIITGDEFTSLLIDQIYINENEQIELIPVLGRASVFVGDAGRLDEKLANIAAFYKAKSTTEEFGHYSLINASFENQIVCTIKRDSI